MGETLANRTKRLKRAAERQRRRKEAIAAIAALGLNDLRNWTVAAAALNAKGARTELGRPWSRRVIMAFVQKQLSSGNRKALKGGGWDRALKEQLLVVAVRKHCSDAANYGVAADILNAVGILTVGGHRWTALRVKGLVQRYPDSGLMPLAGRRGKTVMAAEVVKGMKAIKVGVLTWNGIAAALNAKGVDCPGGGSWNEKKVVRFLEWHWKRSGERVCSWKKDGSGKGRTMGAVLQRHARDVHAKRVLRICGEVSDYHVAAAKLNMAGCRTRMGNVWTGQRLRIFLKHYKTGKGKG